MLLRFFIAAWAIGFAIYLFQIRKSPSDLKAYQTLVQESSERREKKVLEGQTAEQMRSGLVKEIWSEGRERYFRIESERSTIHLNQKKGAIEIEESLENIESWLPEGVSLKAKQGLYSYPSHQLQIQEIGKLEKDDHVIQGDRIDLDFEKQTLCFQNPRGSFQSGAFFFDAKRLIWVKGENLLHLEEEVRVQSFEKFSLLANEGSVQLDGFTPQKVYLRGQVRVIGAEIEGKPSYALADELHYDPVTKELLLCAEKRVLFWQEGLSLSAPKVLIHGKERVEGLGEVHFVFDLEEKNFIEKLLGQYL